MRVLKLVLQYDGTDYVGWQRQETGVSVQALVEQALERIEGEPVAVVGASRTDAGVHALGQVASVCLKHPIEASALVRALNATLPGDIRVLRGEEAQADFHARWSARAKTYRYRLVTGQVVAPFEQRYTWRVGQPLDFDRMVEAAQPLEGRHDFAAFQAAGGALATTVRTIFAVSLTRAPLAHQWYHPGSDGPPPGVAGELLAVEVSGDGFLRHMVRALVGTLVEVGAGRRDPASVAETLASRDRRRAGPTAPAQGLFLVRVEY